MGNGVDCDSYMGSGVDSDSYMGNCVDSDWFAVTWGMVWTMIGLQLHGEWCGQ